MEEETIAKRMREMGDRINITDSGGVERGVQPQTAGEQYWILRRRNWCSKLSLFVTGRVPTRLTSVAGAHPDGIKLRLLD